MKKKICLAILFWGILFVLYLRVNYVLQEKFLQGTSDTFVTKQFYHLEPDSVDVVFLGSSQNVRGVSCMKLLEDYQISAFSIATSAQPLCATYYYLVETLKKQHPRLLILDMSMLYERVKEDGFRRVCDNAPLSRNKLELMWEHMKYLGQKKGRKEGFRYFMSYLFPIMQFHDRWKELTWTDFEPYQRPNKVYRGNIHHTESKPIEGMVIHEDDPPDDKEMVPNQLENFLRIAEYCKEKDIPLLLIKTPKLAWSWNRSVATRELAQKYGLAFYDFNLQELFEEAGFDESMDFSDQSHVNLRGALKLTDWLGKYMMENYDLPKAELTKKDLEDLEGYHQVLEEVFGEG